MNCDCNAHYLRCCTCGKILRCSRYDTQSLFMHIRSEHATGECEANANVNENDKVAELRSLAAQHGISRERISEISKMTGMTEEQLADEAKRYLSGGENLNGKRSVQSESGINSGRGCISDNGGRSGISEPCCNSDGGIKAGREGNSDRGLNDLCANNVESGPYNQWDNNVERGLNDQYGNNGERYGVSKRNCNDEDSLTSLRGSLPLRATDSKILNKRKLYRSSIENWIPVDGPIYCPECGCTCPPTIKTHSQLETSSTCCASCLLSCWPFCFLPCVLPTDNREYLHCSKCKNFLGIYDREINCIKPNRAYIECECPYRDGKKSCQSFQKID